MMTQVIGFHACLLLLCTHPCLPAQPRVPAWNDVKSSSENSINESLQLIDGKTRKFQLIEIRGNGDLVGRTGDQTEVIPAERILRYGHLPQVNRLDTLVFRNGSKLAAMVKKIGPDQVQFESRIFLNATVPTSQLRGILFQQKSNTLSRQKTIDKLLVSNSEKRQAKVVLVNDDVFNGRLVEGQDQQLLIANQGVQPIIPFGKIRFLILPCPQPFDLRFPVGGRLALDDGSLLVFRKLNFNNDHIAVEFDDQVTLRAPKVIRRRPFQNRIRLYEPVQRSFRYLSAEKPLKTVESQQPIFQNTLRNRSSVGGPLSFQSRQYEWGLGTHSRSQIIYAIRSGETTFRCRLALDDSAHGLGHVTCRVVLLQANNQWKGIGSPWTLTPGQAELVEVDVRDARAIGLVTAPGQKGLVGDRVNWLDARIHR